MPDAESEPVADAGSDTVRWDLTEAVGTILLNRPRAHNALTAEMKTALLAALRQAAASPEVRAVLITGAGPAFCAGQDLREHAGLLASPRGGASRRGGHGYRPAALQPDRAGHQVHAQAGHRRGERGGRRRRRVPGAGL